MSEISIYSSVANDIAAWLFLSTILSIGGYKALHTGWVARRTDPMYSKHITQRTRYAMVLIGLACMIPTIYVFIRFGAWDVLQVIDLLTEGDSVFGWAIAIMTMLAFFYVPFAVSIRRRLMRS